MAGNAVMKAKRVRGPSANRVLRTHVAQERCSEAGCVRPVVITKNLPGAKTLRYCVEHFA